MESRFTIVAILTLAILITALFAGVTSANHQTTGALNGPVYDWLKDDDGNSRFDHYGLARPASIYFNGSYLKVDVVLVRTAMELIDKPDNGINEYEDLPKEMKDVIGDEDSIRKAHACPSGETVIITGNESNPPTKNIWQGQERIKIETNADEGTQVTLRVGEGENEGQVVTRYSTNSNGNFYIDLESRSLEGSYRLEGDIDGDTTEGSNPIAYIDITSGYVKDYKDPDDPDDNVVIECDEEAKDTGAYSVVDLYGGNVQDLGMLKDYTFKEPLKATVKNDDSNWSNPVSGDDGAGSEPESQWEINTWNQQSSINGWPFDASKGSNEEVVLPEDKHFERMSENEEGRSRKNYYENPPEREERKFEITYGPQNDTWVAAQGTEMAIYSNDPSVWTHTHRYANIPDDMSSEFAQGKLFDSSYKQIGDQGTLRFVYEKGYMAGNAPSSPRDVPVNPTDGDTRWNYTGADFDVTEYNIYIQSTSSGFCSDRCDITDSVQIEEREDGVVYFDWDLEDSTYDFSGLGGDEVKFIVETTFEVSYDKEIEEADRVCDERASESDAETNPGVSEGDCVDYGIEWNYDSTEYDFIERTTSYSTSEKYYFTDGTGIFKESDDIEVEKAVYPNGRTQYYVEFDQENQHDQIIGWNKITVGDNTTVHSQWKYFSSREKSWDNLYTHTETTNGSKYVSKAKPLRINAYPAYERYNRRDSTTTIVEAERADLDVNERMPSPALVGHTTCVQNYPQEFSEDAGTPSGSYEKHEPCYWEIYAAGQDPLNPPLSYYRLPYRVTNPGWLSAIPGIADNQMSYKEYVFNKDLSSMLQNTNQDDDEESSAYQKLYSGEYTHMDQVVFWSDTNSDEVTVHGMVPEMKADAEVEETVQVRGTQLNVDVLPRCERNPVGGKVNCVENPIESEEYSQYRVEITLTKTNEDGEQVPVNTSTRDGELIVQNSSSDRRDEIRPETNEDGKTTVWIEDPEDSSQPVIDIRFQPEHWRTAEDPLAPSSVTSGGTKSVSDNTNWMLSLAGVILIYWFMTLAINKGLLRNSRKKLTPVKMVLDHANKHTRIFVILAFVALIVFKGPENWYALFVLMIAILLLTSNWNE